MSLNCNGSFNSLREIDELWERYWKACQEAQEREDIKIQKNIDFF